MHTRMLTHAHTKARRDSYQARVNTSIRMACTSFRQSSTAHVLCLCRPVLGAARQAYKTASVQAVCRHVQPMLGWPADLARVTLLS
eukprot:10527050-Alexandrium_andersonii.AAC.1